MDIASRHPRLTKATRILGIVTSGLCIVLLAPFIFLFWTEIAFREAKPGQLPVAIAFTILLLVCGWLFARSIFSKKPKSHSRATLRWFVLVLIAFGVLGLIFSALAFLLDFGTSTHKLLLLSGSLVTLGRGLALRNANA